MAVTSITVHPNPIVRGETATFTVNFDTDVTTLSSSRISVISQRSGQTVSNITRVTNRQWTFQIAVASNEILVWVTVSDPNDGSSRSLNISTLVDPSALTIEAIDEQNIPVLTEDYELEIDIGGDPERAYVDGDMEGFYHTWDPDNARILIKAIQVTRLIVGAIWNVHLVKGSDTLESRIIYNVVPSAPVIENPGPQKLYRGGSFYLDIAIANRPTLARGNSLLAGLKYQARPDGVDGINLAGQLPAAANLTEAAFDANIYTENDGGQDNLAVPVSIETHTGVYIFDMRADDILKIGPDDGTLQWTYEASYSGGSSIGRYDPLVASTDGIYLFSDSTDDLLKVSPGGDLLWTFDAAATGTYGEMVVTESGIYLSSDNIYKVHSGTGEVIWEIDIAYSSNDFQVYAGDIYTLTDYIRNTRSYTLTKLNGEDGTVAWTYPAPSDYRLRFIVDDAVYLQNRGHLIKIDIADGSEAWRRSVSGTSFYTPVIDSQAIYIFAANRNRLYKINTTDGTVAWTFNSPFKGPIVLDTDGVYINDGTSQQRVIKVNASDGSEAWRVSGFTTPVVHPNGLYDFNDGGLRKFDRSDGSVDWTFREFWFDKIIEDGSDLYVAKRSTSAGVLVKLNTSDGREQWRWTPPTTPAIRNFGSLAIPDLRLGV